MTEREDGYGRRGLPKDTAEFRATPDSSASTAQFQAFASGYDQMPAESGPGRAWPDQPDAGRPARSRRMPIVVGVVVAALLVLGVIAVLLHG